MPGDVVSLNDSSANMAGNNVAGGRESTRETDGISVF